MADPYRLPTDVLPSHYDLTLSPDLAAATFAGEVRISVDVHTVTDVVVLNAIELELLDAELTGEDGRAIAATVTYDEDAERATLALGEQVAPGAYTLRIAFTGILNDRLHGFYRSTFKDADGADHVIATTQMEATDARRAFPCWDEPEHKATFTITLVVDDELFAVSNGAEIESTDLGNGRRQVRFAETMKMSTYLVAFVVGPLVATEVVDVDGVPLRVIAPADKIALAPFALETGAAALRYFSDWFGIPYPGGKLDLIAIPDFAFGAMENLGCVTFRETALLLDPATASQAEAQRVADVVNHEIAHMWFGDLVTMKWWNGIWLNEAFATFMELKATDSFRPEWLRWVYFGIERGAAFATDGLDSTRPVEFTVNAPAEAEGMFDVLTYQKGGAVLRMLEQYLGEARFQSGIQLYLRTHAYANAETTDLWDAIEEATGEPVRATMDSWIFQGGHPIVSASLDGSGLVLAQERFRLSGGDVRDDTLWNVPVLVRAGVGGTVEEHRILVTGPTTTLALSGTPDWVVVNSGASGFYRTRYSSDLLRALTANADAVALAPLERHALISDTWAAVLAGLAPLSDLFETVLFLASDDDPDVWAAIATALNTVARAASDADRPAVSAFIQRIAQPALERLGWEPVAGESERTAVLRGTVVGLLGGAGDDGAVKARCEELFYAYLNDRSSVAADLAGPVVNVTAADADELIWDLLLERFTNPATPQEETRFLQALALVDDPVLFQKSLDLALTDQVRSQNAALYLARALTSRTNGPAAWKFIRESWTTLNQRIPSNSVGRMLGGLAFQNDGALAADARGFLAEHPLPQALKLTEQTLEQLDVQVAFAERTEPALASELPKA